MEAAASIAAMEQTGKHKFVGSSLANTLHPAVGKATPSDDGSSGNPAAAIGLQEIDSPIATKQLTTDDNGNVVFVPVERIFMQGSGVVSYLENIPSGGQSGGVTLSRLQVPVHLARYFRRRRMLKRGYLDQPLPDDLVVPFWKFHRERRSETAAFEHPALAAYRVGRRSSHVPRIIRRSLVDDSEAWLYRYGTPLVTAAVANSYWSGTGTQLDTGVATTAWGALRTASTNNTARITNDEGEQTDAPLWGSIQSVSPVPNMATVAIMFARRGTTINIEVRADAGLTYSILVMDPKDPHWNTNSGGHVFLMASPTGANPSFTFTLPTTYTNLSSESVQIGDSARWVVCINNPTGGTLNVTSILVRYVYTAGANPDYTVTLMPDASLVDQSSLLQTQLGNHVTFECTSSEIENQGEIIAANLPAEWIERNGPDALSYDAISALPRKQPNAAKLGISIGGLQSAQSQLLKSSDDELFPEDHPQNLWTVAIRNAVAPFLLHSRVRECITQEGQAWTRVQAVADALDLQRAQAVQAVLPVATPFGKDGLIQKAFLGVVETAYDAACLAFPRLEQVGDLAKFVYNAAKSAWSE